MIIVKELCDVFYGMQIYIKNYVISKMWLNKQKRYDIIICLCI